MATVEFENPASNVIEEVTVVGNGHNSTLIVVQEALKPCDRFSVQVVGRLVE